jgi:hypothetical protein
MKLTSISPIKQELDQDFSVDDMQFWRFLTTSGLSRKEPLAFNHAPSPRDCCRVRQLTGNNVTQAFRGETQGDRVNERDTTD